MSSTHATLLALRTAQNTAMADLISRLIHENSCLGDELFEERRRRVLSRTAAHDELATVTEIKRFSSTMHAEVENFVKEWWEEYRHSKEALEVDKNLGEPELSWDSLWPFMRHALLTIAHLTIA